MGAQLWRRSASNAPPASADLVDTGKFTSPNGLNMAPLRMTALTISGYRRALITGLLAILVSVAVMTVVDPAPVRAGQSVSNAPADVGVAGSSHLAVVVVGVGLIGVLLFGVRLFGARLLTSRRARRQ